MKKKFLSLLMAGAMVVGTAMPTHASTTIVGGDESKTHDAKVTVSGSVDTSEGEAPAGKIQVEVPTAVSFTVNKDGELSAVPFTITNRGKDSIDVMVGSFQETKADEGIEVHPKGTSLEGKDRSNITLQLRGNNEVDLAGTHTGTEILSTIAANTSGTISLVGSAGKAASTEGGVDETGVAEDFNLVFKIKKSNQ